MSLFACSSSRYFKIFVILIDDDWVVASIRPRVALGHTGDAGEAGELEVRVAEQIGMRLEAVVRRPRQSVTIIPGTV